MNTADIKERIKKKLDADTDTPASLRLTLAEEQLWELIRDAIPQIPQYRSSEQWWNIKEEEFYPYYDLDEDEDVISVNPLLFRNASGVVVNKTLSLEESPSTGSIETTPDYEEISTDKAMDIKATDFNYKRNIYYKSKYGGFVSIHDYEDDSTTYGSIDGRYYVRKKYDGIFAIKVELVTEDIIDDPSGLDIQTAAIDISLDGGDTWLSNFMEIEADTEIDVSGYPSSSLTFKLTLTSNTSTSPKVHSMRASVWAVKDLAKNADYLVDLSYANYLERLQVRADMEGMADIANNLGQMVYNIRRRVAGYFDDGKIRPKETGAARFDAPKNKYARSYFRDL